MIKKTFLVVIAFLAAIAIVAALGGIKFVQIRKAMAEHASFALPPESVTSLVAEEEEWIPSLKAVGSTAAVQGVTVSTDEPGIVHRIDFESGQAVKEGDLLVQLEISQEQAQLRSAEAQMRLAGANLLRQQNLLKSRVSSQADYDSAQAQYDQAAAKVEEVKALISKKTIRAPFSGVLGIRAVNLGQYLQSGAQVAPLQSLDPIYVNFWLPQQNLGQITAGQLVRVQADGLPNITFDGKINAVDAVVDEATRNVRVQATLPNPNGLLRPGMFVNTEVPLSSKSSHVVLPATAIQYAPYGDMVYVIEDMKGPDGKAYRGVRQQVVKLGESRGDRVAILSGVNPGEEVVTSGVFKLRPGAHVQVNNSILPDNSEAPKPEDT
ncbi:MAG TPA: efflux RND transporter periplasmic adaptor subunit [Terrimicrobiaceae bacterium]